MKKNLIILAGMAVLISAVSCSIEENKIDPIPTDPRVPMTFTAGEFTKTSLVPGDNENAVLWSAGDAISIFDGTNNNEFTLTDGASTAFAKFEGEAVPDQKYYALYPYSETASLSGTTITSSLPAEQQYVGATFDTMLNPSVAVADENNNLAFYNVASILQINVSELQGKSVREIQISADKSLTGEYTVAMSNTEPYAAVASTGTEISGLRLLVDSADMETEQNSEGNISCYAVVLPGTYDNLKISVIYSDNSYSEKSFEKVTLEPSDGNFVNVKASEATANNRGLYGLFMAGQDIYIGGKAYNKSQYEENMIKLFSSTTIGSIYNTSKDKEGNILYGDGTIIFVEQGATVTNFGNAGNIVVVGNDPENKPTINKTGYSNLNVLSDGSSKVVFANVILDLTKMTVSQNYAFVASGMNFPELTFDSCEILMHESKYLAGITTKDRSIDKIVLTNCDIRIPAGTSNRYIVHTGTVDTAVEEAVFTNNVFYCPADYIYNFRVFSGNTYDESSNVTNSTDIGSLVFNNNTLVNLRYQNSALLVCDNISYAEISKNIVYFNQLYSSNNSINFLIATTNYPTSAECSDNIVYDSNVVDGVPAYNMFYHSQYNGVLGSNPVVLTASPLQGTDFKNGIFTPTAEYASYGAQR